MDILESYQGRAVSDQPEGGRFELCDYNGLHVPVRQILLLLTNAVLGHPDVNHHLMVPADVPRVIAAIKGVTTRV